MGILKHRAVKHFVHIHMAGKWQGRDSNPGNLVAEHSIFAPPSCTGQPIQQSYGADEGEGYEAVGEAEGLGSPQDKGCSP